MAALTTLNITEKNANNSLSVTVKVNVIWVEYTEPEQRGRLFNLINKKK